MIVDGLMMMNTDGDECPCLPPVKQTLYTMCLHFTGIYPSPPPPALQFSVIFVVVFVFSWGGGGQWLCGQL